MVALKSWQIECVCEICAKSFVRQRTDVTVRGWGRFCSRKCAGVDAYKHGLAKRTPEQRTAAGVKGATTGHLRGTGFIWTKENVIEPSRRGRAKRMENIRASQVPRISTTPIGRQAHRAVWRAIKQGVLVRPSACETCNESKPLDAHHEDYAKPLDVKWLCKGCHRVRHAEIDRLEREAREAAHV